jgi:hypothetical protein
MREIRLFGGSALATGNGTVTPTTDRRSGAARSAAAWRPRDPAGDHSQAKASGPEADLVDAAGLGLVHFGGHEWSSAAVAAWTAKWLGRDLGSCSATSGRGPGGARAPWQCAVTQDAAPEARPCGRTLSAWQATRVLNHRSDPQRRLVPSLLRWRSIASPEQLRARWARSVVSRGSHANELELHVGELPQGNSLVSPSQTRWAPHASLSSADHSPPCISSQWTSRSRRSHAAAVGQLAAAEMDQS